MIFKVTKSFPTTKFVCIVQADSELEIESKIRLVLPQEDLNKLKIEDVTVQDILFKGVVSVYDK